MIKHTEFSACLKENYRTEPDNTLENSMGIFAASLHDINKMLAPKKKLTQPEIKAILPPSFTSI